MVEGTRVMVAVLGVALSSVPVDLLLRAPSRPAIVARTLIVQ